MSRESPSGWTRETEATPAVMTLDPEERAVQLAQSVSEEYQPVTECVPAEMPLVVPVTGESFCQCPTQTDLSSQTHLDGHAQECTCGEDESGCVWVWDEECKSPAVFLSCSNRKVSFHPEYSCGTAAIRGSAELRHGQHFWEIKMTSPVYGTDMMVGIGTPEVNLDQFRHSFCSMLGVDAHSWGLSYTGLLHHKGSKINFSPRFGQGSIIGLHLDTWHGTLTLYKNRRWIGVAATGLRNKTFYPMVCSTAAKSSMKMISSVSTPTSLQYLCCTSLRKYLPEVPDALSAVPLPPGLRSHLSQQLGWVLKLRKPEASTHTCAEDSQTPHLSLDHDPYLDFISSTPADTYLSSHPDSASFTPVDTYLTSHPDSTSFLDSAANHDSACCTPADICLTCHPDSASLTQVDTYLTSHPDAAANHDSAYCTPADICLTCHPDSASLTQVDTYLTSHPDAAANHDSAYCTPADICLACHPDSSSFLDDDEHATYPDSAYCTPAHTYLSSRPDSASCRDASLDVDPDSFSDLGSCSDSASCSDLTSCPCCDVPLSLVTGGHDDCPSSASCCSGPTSRPASPLPNPSYCGASPLPVPTHSRPSSASASDSGSCCSETCQRKRCRWT